MIRDILGFIFYKYLSTKMDLLTPYLNQTVWPFKKS
jgi:hypothetical protein